MVNLFDISALSDMLSCQNSGKRLSNSRKICHRKRHDIVVNICECSTSLKSTVQKSKCYILLKSEFLLRRLSINKIITEKNRFHIILLSEFLFKGSP